MLRRSTVALLVAGLTLLAGPATAYFGGTEVFIASTGRGPGASSSQWYTTLWVHNPNPSPANVQFSFLLRDQTNPASPYLYNETIQGGDTKRYDNAVFLMFGIEGFGAIRVVSNQSLLVNSRIYSVPSGGDDSDTVGQFFAAVPASFAVGFGQTTQLLGVYQTTPPAASQFRYNFGFVETTGGNASLRVTAYDTGGASLGFKDYSLGPYEVRQYTFSNEFPAISSSNVRLAVAVTAGGGKVVAFGSGLANTSNDPSTFEMAFDQAMLAGGLTAVTHDATLTGDGTGTSPLGIANGGVSKSKLAAAGGSSGQLLSTNGVALQWVDPSSGGLTLPFSGSTGSGSPAFQANNTGTGVGVYGSSAAGVAGVHGRVETMMFGVLGQSAGGSGVAGGSTNKYGVEGESTNSIGVRGIGGGSLSGFTPSAAGDTRAGVWGDSFASVGVLGASKQSHGVKGVHTGSSSSAAGVYGEAPAYGLHGQSTSGKGVYGQSTSGYGVQGQSTSSYGVYGSSTTGYGVYASNAGSARNQAALRASNSNTNGGMAAYMTNNSQYATAHFFNDGSGEVLYLQADGGFFIKAVNKAENDAEFTVDYSGNVRADGTFASPAADFAELLPADSGLEPGDLVAIGPDGTLVLTDTALQSNVAGIYSTKPAFLGGDSEAPGAERIPLAIVGIVPVKASAESGAIRPGDLLVASATPGHAMRCADRLACNGTIVGKALSPLATGTGIVTVLVSLN